MYLPTRRVGDLLLFPCPEFSEQGLDVRGLAHDRGDGPGRPYFVRTALAMRSVLGSSRRARNFYNFLTIAEYNLIESS